EHRQTEVGVDRSPAVGAAVDHDRRRTHSIDSYLNDARIGFLPSTAGSRRRRASFEWRRSRRRRERPWPPLPRPPTGVARSGREPAMADNRTATASARGRLRLPSALQPCSRKENGMSAPTPLRADGTWGVDPEHSSIEFRVRHLMIEAVKGRFLDFEGALETGEAPQIAGRVRAA